MAIPELNIFYDIIRQKAKAGCLNIWHNLLSGKLNSRIPFIIGETWWTLKSGEHFFVSCIGADYNRCCKITWFAIFVRSWLGGGGWCNVLNIRRRGEGYENGLRVNKWGSKVWSFCDNVIIVQLESSLRNCRRCCLFKSAL